MEILIVTHKYDTSVGGMEKHCLALVEGLDSLAYETHVISPKKGQSKRSFMLSISRNIKQVVTEHPSIQVIYFNDCLAALFGIKTGQKLKIPMVATAHGLDITFSNYLYQSLLRKRLPLLNQIICVSRHTAKRCKQLGIQKSKLSVIPNGVDTKLHDQVFSSDLQEKLLSKIAQLPQSKKIIFGVGRLVRRKGFSWFIKNVLPEIREGAILVLAGPMDKFSGIQPFLLNLLPSFIRKQLEVIIGYDNEVEVIQHLMNDSKYQHSFVHLGRLTDEELSCMYHLSDICIMPNIKVPGDIEGFGLVALEAGIHGKLVIASKLQGIKDAIDNSKNGWLIPSGNPSKWIATIKSVLPNAELRKDLGLRAQAYNTENFSWTKMAKRYNDIFSLHAKSKLVQLSHPKTTQQPAYYTRTVS